MSIGVNYIGIEPVNIEAERKKIQASLYSEAFLKAVQETGVARYVVCDAGYDHGEQDLTIDKCKTWISDLEDMLAAAKAALADMETKGERIPL